MLDADTKRRIDTARDILVGKVPDPKSQVEQITIALIYKFMDDIDAESEELGGQRKFFAGDFAKYGWARLTHPSLGGYETLNLYAEAITNMTQNRGIPQLFRDIFNNAYLPYRDPETLRAFLKVIDEFSYDHSERLGDAFEYLLSVLGAQGDAGQFRTPRHIIDFIVSIVDPKKDEKILDPACGTAGFLISAYKHILAANSDEAGRDTLTPDERGRLAANLEGYDISPDMVRLSRANMYLHGFRAPLISEYDTLTSEERWDEFADVILANPPFMSPKGGIRPHSRFSIKSKRSEVLFVDYMAEHLSARGRAGIIVPEGVIFQSQNAHKQLRKKLLDEALVAIISLPSGVFKPYSGVKTSILILDKTLAKRTDSVAFFKVENDGYDLGDQRRPIAESDLPDVARAAREYLDGLSFTKSAKVQEEAAYYDADSDASLETALVVSKDRIAEGGEFNLSGERYRESEHISEWPMVALEEISDEIKSGFACGKGRTGVKGVPHIRPMNITEAGQFTWDGVKRISDSDYSGREDYSLVPGDILFNNTNSKELVGKTCHINQSISGGFSNHITRIRVNSSICISEFIAYVLHDSWKKGRFLDRSNKWIGQAGINTKSLSTFQIPLPPLEVQREIVAEIEGYQKVIDGARAVVENWRPHIAVDPEWPVVKLGESSEINPENIHPDTYKVENIFYIDISSVENETGHFMGYREIPVVEAPSRARRRVRNKDVLLSTVRPNLKAFTLIKSVNKYTIASTGFAVIRARDDVAKPEFILESIRSDYAVNQMVSMMGKGAYPSINQKDVASIRVALPPLETQQAIVAEIEAERSLVDANRELIGRMEKKIEAAIGRVWETAR